MAAKDAALIFILCGLLGAKSKIRERNCEKLRNDECVRDYLQPECDGYSNLVECGAQVVRDAQDCSDEVKTHVAARLLSLRHIENVICEDTGLQESFRKETCWKSAASCVISAIVSAFKYDINSDYEEEECENTYLILDACIGIGRANCDEGVYEDFVDKVKEDLPCQSCKITAFRGWFLIFIAAFLFVVYS